MALLTLPFDGPQILEVFAAARDAWLLAAALVSTATILGARRAHRFRLTLTAAAPSDDPAILGSDIGQVRGIDHPVAVAYCLPGWHPRVVISSGAFESLERADVEAVVAHERSHARGRHDLVVLPFVARQRAFRALPTSARALQAVELLVEMLADDDACHHSDPARLCHAIEQLGKDQSGERTVRAHRAVHGPGARRGWRHVLRP